MDHLTHSTLLQKTATRPYWFHKSTCIFSHLLIHSAIIYWAPTRLKAGLGLGIERRIWPSSWPSGLFSLVLTCKQTPMIQKVGSVGSSSYNWCGTGRGHSPWNGGVAVSSFTPSRPDSWVTHSCINSFTSSAIHLPEHNLLFNCILADGFAT